MLPSLEIVLHDSGTVVLQTVNFYRACHFSEVEAEYWALFETGIIGRTIYFGLDDKGEQILFDIDG